MDDADPPDRQPDFFARADDAAPTWSAPDVRRHPRGVEPAEPGADVVALAARLEARYGGRLHLGTSSWHFPGWAGLVWAGRHAEQQLSRQGLAA